MCGGGGEPWRSTWGRTARLCWWHHHQLSHIVTSRHRSSPTARAVWQGGRRPRTCRRHPCRQRRRRHWRICTLQKGGMSFVPSSTCDRSQTEKHPRTFDLVYDRVWGRFLIGRGKVGKTEYRYTSYALFGNTGYRYTQEVISLRYQPPVRFPGRSWTGRGFNARLYRPYIFTPTLCTRTLKLLNIIPWS